jgi:hypothetical protein
MMAEPDAISFVEALHGRVDDILDLLHALR